MNRRRLAIAALALLPGVALACSDIWGFHDLTLLDGGADASQDAPTDAAPEAHVEANAPDAMPDAAPGCMHAVPPGPPSTDDTPDGGDGGVDVVLALSTLDLGQNSSSAFDPNHPLGFDLDGVCTCFDDAGGSCTGVRQVCDTAGGRDESANVVLAALAVDPQLSQSGLQAALSAGNFGVLLHVHGYNGLANDQSVIVEYFPSGGTRGVPPDAGGAAWTVTSGSVFNGMPGAWVSNYLDDAAYVNDFVLVSHLTTFPLLIVPNLGNNNPITLSLADVVVAAPLVQVGGSWTIQGGQLGARWPTSAALYDLHTIQDLSGQSLCGSDLTYMTLVSHICDNADIAAASTQDDAGVACSALSVGLGFGAAPATMGGEYDPPAVGVDCPDGWAPACN